MTKFLPDYAAMPTATGQYMACFKIMKGDDWQTVREEGRPLQFPTRSQAVQAAKDQAERIMNPKIRSEVFSKPKPDHAMKAQEDRLKQQADGQRAAFGSVIVKGHAVKVEKKR